LGADIVQGKPIRIDQQELIPFVRVASRVRRSAFLGDDEVTATGRVCVDMRPVAILRRSEKGEQSIRIRDETAARLRQLLVMAIFIACAGVVLTRVAGMIRPRRALA